VVQERLVQQVVRRLQASGDARRAHRGDLAPEQVARRDAARPRPAGPLEVDPHVDVVAAEVLVVPKLAQLHADVGVRQLKRPQPGHEPTGAERGDDAQAQRGALCPCFAELGEGPFQFDEARFDARMQRTRGGIGHHALCAALEEGAADAPFEACDGAAHGRLAHAQLLGGLAHGARVADTHEGMQFDE
jgi:hypothetical protein